MLEWNGKQNKTKEMRFKKKLQFKINVLYTMYTLIIYKKGNRL